LSASTVKKFSYVTQSHTGTLSSKGKVVLGLNYIPCHVMP